MAVSNPSSLCWSEVLFLFLLLYLLHFSSSILLAAGLKVGKPCLKDSLITESRDKVLTRSLKMCKWMTWRFCICSIVLQFIFWGQTMNDESLKQNKTKTLRRNLCSHYCCLLKPHLITIAHSRIRFSATSLIINPLNLLLTANEYTPSILLTLNSFPVRQFFLLISFLFSLIFQSWN